MKDVGMRIRVEPELREEFVKICRDKDVPAARVLRAFMKEFVEKEGDTFQTAFSFEKENLSVLK